jgi:hypothetical protein
MKRPEPFTKPQIGKVVANVFARVLGGLTGCHVDHDDLFY